LAPGSGGVVCSLSLIDLRLPIGGSFGQQPIQTPQTALHRAGEGAATAYGRYVFFVNSIPRLSTAGSSIAGNPVRNEILKGN
jgi:hypothetical protein